MYVSRGLAVYQVAGGKDNLMRTVNILEIDDVLQAGDKWHCWQDFDQVVNILSCYYGKRSTEFRAIGYHGGFVERPAPKPAKRKPKLSELVDRLSDDCHIEIYNSDEIYVMNSCQRDLTCNSIAALKKYLFTLPERDE